MNQIDDHPGVVGPNDKVMVARNRRVSQGSRKKIVYDTTHITTSHKIPLLLGALRI